MTKVSAKEIEAVGWAFWAICFFVLLGPCVYVAWQVSYESVSRIAPVSFGFMAAAMGSGVISWVVNSSIQIRVRRRQKSVRKQKKKNRK